MNSSRLQELIESLLPFDGSAIVTGHVIHALHRQLALRGAFMNQPVSFGLARTPLLLSWFALVHKFFQKTFRYRGPILTCPYVTAA